METDSLAVALEREHHEIDAGIEAFTASPGDSQPLTRAIRALRRHIYLEEEFLFPLLRQVESALGAPIFVMLREHAQIWATLDALELEPSPGAALGRQLSVQLLHHNLKEERVLYPRADDALPPEEAGRLRAFLGSGELPEGWVCAKARTATPQRRALARHPRARIRRVPRAGLRPRGPGARCDHDAPRLPYPRFSSFLLK